MTERAIFKDVRLVRPVQDGFKRYADYIGSVLEILDIQRSSSPRWCVRARDGVGDPRRPLRVSGLPERLRETVLRDRR